LVNGLRAEIENPHFIRKVEREYVVRNRPINVDLTEGESHLDGRRARIAFRLDVPVGYAFRSMREQNTSMLLKVGTLLDHTFVTWRSRV
jgi:hypothetical protein